MGTRSSHTKVVGANTNVLLRNVKTRKQQDNINYNDTIEGQQFHKLFNECGYHLILEDKASYEHLINQCQQVGSLPIALFGGANKELISNDMDFHFRVKKEKVMTKNWDQDLHAVQNQL